VSNASAVFFLFLKSSPTLERQCQVVGADKVDEVLTAVLLINNREAVNFTLNQTSVQVCASTRMILWVGYPEIIARLVIRLVIS